MTIQGGRIQKANKKSLNAKGKGKGKGKEKDKSYIPKPKNPKPSAKEHPSKDDACHHCKEVGHCKRNCPAYLAELIKKKKQVGTASSSDIFVIELFYFPTKSWVYDTDYGILVSKNDVLYFNAIPSNGIYEIDMSNLVPNVNSIYNVRNKRVKHNLDSTYLWHCRLAHISKKRIEKLQHDGLLKSTDDESFDKCVSCLSGKMTRNHFHIVPKGRLIFLASFILMFVDHLDMCQDKVIKNEVENQLEKTIKALRSDRGGKYISQEFKDYLKACGIVQQLTPSDTPFAARILNMVPTKKVDKTPYELCVRAGELEEIQDEDTPPSEITSKIPMEVEGYEPPHEEEAPVCRGSNEPANYKAAILDLESDKWFDAMNAEMQSMKDNKVW
ncbi:retrotransposon protein, putative, ty1-copia subclass, partial [Tanacetum coccineum]